ncbi:MAG: type II toxin-antitoxin system RelE/ParE family toxin [Methylococcaceae bacterium]|nr:type II toxin-antitoxin system RelE/ParE family toxin [Methylococcaceae bacterium]
MYTFIELPIFTRYAADYFSDDALAELQASIAKNPNQGDVIRGTNGVRKLRWSRAGMGKRGGVRVIYFVQDSLGRIWLLTVYAKSSQENIAVSTLNQLKEVAENANII